MFPDQPGAETPAGTSRKKKAVLRVVIIVSFPPDGEPSG
jgi:hypothetical protein